MRISTNFLRIIVGIIFIISGLVKTIDPIGFSYKLDEYFSPAVFNIHFLQELALQLSILFVLLEVLLGVLLLLGLFKRITVYSLLVMIIFFSFLTFYSAYYNKVTDCGCFGDALKLKPWTSFFKDIILLIFIIVLVKGLKYIKPLFSFKINIGILIVSFIISGFIAYQGVEHLPIIDFRPYAVGKDLNQGLKDGQPQEDVIVYVMRNLKNNQTKEFTSDQYINSNIWQDTLTWKIEKTNVKVIKEAVLPSVHDFNVDCGKEDRTEEVLQSDKIAIFTVPFADEINVIQKAVLRKITNELAKKNIKFVIVSNDPDQLMPIKSCAMDQTTIKTINRSNPGLMILKKGVVVAKYHFSDFPKVKEIKKL